MNSAKSTSTYVGRTTLRVEHHIARVTHRADGTTRIEVEDLDGQCLGGVTAQGHLSLGEVAVSVEVAA